MLGLQIVVSTIYKERGNKALAFTNLKAEIGLYDFGVIEFVKKTHYYNLKNIGGRHDNWERELMRTQNLRCDNQ